jgi:predicted ribosome quality control (RQC) complex YloA/Tae2 family protein
MPTPEIIARNTMWWSNEVDRLEEVIKSLRNDINTYNQVLSGLKNGELTLDNIQVLESGQLRVMPPTPKPDPEPPTCDEAKTKEFGKATGKKSEVAVADLVEVGSGA